MIRIHMTKALNIITLLIKYFPLNYLKFCRGKIFLKMTDLFLLVKFRRNYG